MLIWVLSLACLGLAEGAGRINGRNITDWFDVSELQRRRRIQTDTGGGSRLVRVDASRWRPPPNAVRVDTDTWVLYDNDAETDDGVLAWAPMRDEYKYWVDLPLTRGLVVGHSPGAEAEVVRVVEATHARVVQRAPGRMRVSLTSSRAVDTLHRLAALPGVRWIDRAPNVTHWTAAALASQHAWVDAQTCCANETLSLADTGLDRNHCVFFDGMHPVSDVLLSDAAPYVIASDTQHKKLKAYVRVCPSPGCATPTDTMDASGHGTHVAGILAGSTTCEGASGAPLSRLVFFDIESREGQLELPLSMESMWRSAQLAGARIFSASWGGWCDGVYDDFAAQFDAWAWQNPEFIFIVAAGNCGDAPGQNNLASPASAKNVVSVGASFLGAEAYADGSRGYPASLVNAAPERVSVSTMASFSSFGPMDDGRTGPLIAAPGVRVRSAFAGGPPGHFGTILMSGTSMAAPNVPTALVLRELRDQGFERPWSATVRAVLVAHAEPESMVVDATSLTVIPTLARRAGFGIFSFTPLSGVVLQMHASKSFSIASERCFQPTQQDVRVVLSWTDPPGSPLTTVALVNTLNVLVFSATTTDPIVFDAGDQVNNHRRFDIVLPGKPLIHVLVRAVHLSLAQPYALVVTNATEVTCPVEMASETCAVPHGTGLRIHGECRARSCDVGFGLSASGCMPASGTGLAACTGEGETFNGTGCACSGFLGHIASGCLARCTDRTVQCLSAPPMVKPLSLSEEDATLWLRIWLGIVMAVLVITLFVGASVLDDDMKEDVEGQVKTRLWTSYHWVYLLLIAIVLVSSLVCLVIVPDASPWLLLGMVVLASSMVIFCMPHTPTILCMYMFVVAVLTLTVLSTSIPVIVTGMVIAFVALVLASMLADRELVLYMACSALVFSLGVLALVQYDPQQHDTGPFVLLIILTILSGMFLLVSLYLLRPPSCPLVYVRPPTGKSPAPSKSPTGAPLLNWSRLVSTQLRHRR